MATYVVKISSQLTWNIPAYASPILKAMRRNRVVVVSGGAVRRGIEAAGLTMATATTLQMQAAAGPGQLELMKEWQACCGDTKIAQFLYTHHLFDDPTNNIREVIDQALDMGMLPVANGLDTVTNEETRLTAKVSENSGVASRLAVILEADTLVMLGNQPYIYDSSPETNPFAQPIREVIDLSDEFLEQFPKEEAQDGSFGGIRANVESCLYAARRGVKVVVTSGRNHKNLPRILRGEEVTGTVFRPQKAM